MKKYKNPVDELISKTLNKPSDDGLHAKLFDYLFSVSPKAKKECRYCTDKFTPIKDEDFCCDACELAFYDEHEVEVDENDCPDEDKEIEIILKEEKKNKCF